MEDEKCFTQRMPKQMYEKFDSINRAEGVSNNSRVNILVADFLEKKTLPRGERTLKGGSGNISEIKHLGREIFDSMNEDSDINLRACNYEEIFTFINAFLNSLLNDMGIEVKGEGGEYPLRYVAPDDSCYTLSDELYFCIVSDVAEDLIEGDVFYDYKTVELEDGVIDFLFSFSLPDEQVNESLIEKPLDDRDIAFLSDAITLGICKSLAYHIIYMNEQKKVRSKNQKGKKSGKVCEENTTDEIIEN